MHLDDGQIQAVLHREATRESSTAARAHVETCVECRRAVERAREEEAQLFTLLGQLDLPHPAGDLQRVLMMRRARLNAMAFRRAAAAVLLVGVAGVVLALPTSPLRRWLEERRGAAASPPIASRSESPSPDSVAAQSTAPEADVAGVRVAPGASMRIRFSAAQTSGEMQVALVDDGEIAIRAMSGSVTYAAGTGLLVVQNTGATASYVIEVPRHAPYVVIEVAGRRVWWKDGARVRNRVSPDATDTSTLSVRP